MQKYQRSFINFKDKLQSSLKRSAKKNDKQKIIDTQNERIRSHNIDNDELIFLRLNLEYGEKCRKKAFFKKGFKTGSPEYKNCVMKKGRL